MNKHHPLDPEVKSIAEKCGTRYSQCRVEIVLEVSDKKGGRKELQIEYPVQENRHLISLMQDKATGKHISHEDMLTIKEVIEPLVGGSNR
jgi:hypothetical protein